MLRRRSPEAYRAFVAQWRDLHQRGVAERLRAMDDAALRHRMERMILDQPGLADLHESARAYLHEHRDDVPVATFQPQGPSRAPEPLGRPRTLQGRRLRRRPRTR